MRALIFSDIHNDARALDKLMAVDADYYFAAGDLVSFARGLDKMGEVMQSRADRVYIIPGNHESEQDIATLCTRFGFTNFHGQTLTIDTPQSRPSAEGDSLLCPEPEDTSAKPNTYSPASGKSGLSPSANVSSTPSVIRIAGLGYSSPTPFNTPGEYTEDQLAARLEKFSAFQPDVLICHAPPLNTALDRIREGLHGGSRAVRDYVEKHQPRYFFCGHIHEAEGVVIQMGATRAQNVGKRGYLLEI